MLMQYIEHNFSESSQGVIDIANDIIGDFRADGLTLTLRQLYYQFVGRDLIPNTEQSYKRLGKIVSRGREAGLISWTAIEDRTRGHNAYLINEDETEALNGIEYGIAFDLWERQGIYVETWVEKEALVNVIERPCSEYRVPYMACKGYLSASEAWRAGRRFQRQYQAGRECFLFHLGDHDPSGIDMTRDNTDRLDLFGEHLPVTVRRLALNMDQIDEHSPPPNPAKVTDSRSSGYIETYGKSSWELDALNPRVIRDLIDTNIRGLIDFDLWEASVDEEEASKQRLVKLYDNWPEISDFIDENIE